MTWWQWLLIGIGVLIAGWWAWLMAPYGTDRAFYIGVKDKESD